MKKALLYLLGLAVIALALCWYIDLSHQARPVQLDADTGNVERGAYLARASGCIACHTNVDEGGAPLAGGPPIDTPFGTFYAPNLTMDKEQGIGDWTLEDFARALRHGTSPDGQPYYPAFPYSFYTRLSDQDIADLWAAFQTVPAVAEPSKQQELSFPFNIRSGLPLWQALYLDDQRFEVDPQQSEQYNRGAYLVEAAAHCAACHTPRDLLGGLDQKQAMAGAEGMPGGGRSPAITANALKENGWTTDDLAYALRSGITPEGDVLGGSMAEVIRDGTSFLTDDDLQAIALYLMNRE